MSNLGQSLEDRDIAIGRAVAIEELTTALMQNLQVSRAEARRLLGLPDETSGLPQRFEIPPVVIDDEYSFERDLECSLKQDFELIFGHEFDRNALHPCEDYFVRGYERGFKNGYKRGVVIAAKRFINAELESGLFASEDVLESGVEIIMQCLRLPREKARALLELSTDAAEEC